MKIGSNVIIGACSLITKDIPDNCVAAGVPARVIESFDEYLEKRMKCSDDIVSGNEAISQETETRYWRKFEYGRRK